MKLYEKRDLTDEEAERIIGDRMMARINAINKWVKENDYIIAFHSTAKENIKGILEEGLNQSMDAYNNGESNDKIDILNSSSVTQKELNALEKKVIETGKKCILGKLYDTYDEHAATITIVELTARELLGYNHRGGTATIVLCYPQKKTPDFHTIDDPNASVFSLSAPVKYDGALRRRIMAKKSPGSGVEFISEFLYPTEGILFVFDREKIRIKFNDKFDETYYFDSNYIPKHDIKKGDIKKEVEEAITRLESSNTNSI